jgi:hypothetical protein
VSEPSQPRAARVAVILPTHDRAAFLPRAIQSLLTQTCTDWELRIVDDGSTDGTAGVVRAFLDDPRVTYDRLPANVGLGGALNRGLDTTTAPLVAYLPSDDVVHRDHLATLVEALDANPDAALALAGVRHHYNRETLDTVDGGYQLVQVLHRRTDDRWLERDEFVTDDLGAMLWRRLLRRGKAVATGRVTCEWVHHPDQLTDLVREPLGGINPYRQRYAVQHPLRFRTSVGDPIDEVAHFRRFRDRPGTPPASDGLRILLVGELSYNPERILALEERGHRLWGLWTPDPAWYTMVGPVPFGHVRELSGGDWRHEVRRLRPDVIYGLLNWHAVPFAAEVRRSLPEIPFVWHFKEGPFISRERGTWPDLLELTERSDGVIHSSPELAEWFATFVPGAAHPERSLVLDGDLPRAEWFEGRGGRRSPRLSDADGALHTVVPGRPIGLHPSDVAALAANGVHLHFHGRFTHGQWREWIDRTRPLARRHLHLHPTVGQVSWVRVFSRYDAGWLHVFRSRNEGDLARADWDDLNLPARMATLAAAGLPMIQADNAGSRVAIQTVGRELGVGLFHRDAEELAATLRDGAAMNALRANVDRHRSTFTFDAHADRLIAFFRSVIDGRAARGGAQAGRIAR